MNAPFRHSAILVPNARMASIRIFKHLGAALEDADKRGLTHAVEHMCFRGSEKFPTDRDVEMATQDMGATLNACTTHQGICFQIDAPDYEARRAHDLLTDILARPLLLPEAWKTEKGVIIEEIATRDNSQDAIAKLTFGDDWPSRPVIGFASHVRKFSIADIRGWHKRVKNAPTTVVVAGSDATLKNLSAASRSNSERALFPSMPLTNYARKQDVAVMSDHMSKLEVAFPLHWDGFMHHAGIRLSAAQIYVTMLQTKLFEQCRSKKGLVYSIHTWLEHFDDVQLVHINAEVSEKNIVPLAKEVLRMLEGMDDDLADSEALYKACCRHRAASAYINSMYTEEVADHEIWSRVLHRRSEFLDTLQNRYLNLLDRSARSVLPTHDRRFGPYVVAAVEGGDAAYKQGLKKKLAKLVKEFRYRV